MEWRLGRLEDELALRAIFAKQDLAVRLPLPGIDPAVVSSVVGEDNGQVKVGIIQRSTVETHLIIDPFEPNAPQIVTDGQKVAVGVTLAVAEQMRRMGFGAPDDIIAFVPRSNPQMHRLMLNMGFVNEVDAFQAMYRKMGQLRK